MTPAFEPEAPPSLAYTSDSLFGSSIHSDTSVLYTTTTSNGGVAAGPATAGGGAAGKELALSAASPMEVDSVELADPFEGLLVSADSFEDLESGGYGDNTEVAGGGIGMEGEGKLEGGDRWYVTPKEGPTVSFLE